jgi:hypothetical protein
MEIFSAARRSFMLPVDELKINYTTAGAGSFVQMPKRVKPHRSSAYVNDFLLNNHHVYKHAAGQ